MVPVWVLCDLPAMCVHATGLRFFKIVHCAEFNKIVEAMMPGNPYDGRRVSLWWAHGKVILDIVQAS